MITTPEANGGEQDGRALDAPGTRHAGSRRAMLGAAAGGFALATSGLLLPGWLVEEAAADNHPARRVQDRKQQKRDKRRHKREHNRQLKSRGSSPADSPRGGTGIYGIEFHVWNTGSRSFSVNFFTVVDSKDKGGPYLNWKQTSTISGSDMFDTGISRAALWIDNRFYIEVDNPLVGFPTIKMGFDGRIVDSSIPFKPRGWIGGTTTFDEIIKEDQRTPTTSIYGFSTVVTRLEDHYPRKIFHVDAGDI